MIPTYRFKGAPSGLATIRQLRAMGLRPGGNDPVAQIEWRKGKRLAYLYSIEIAKPKRVATAAQMIAINKALTARRTCPECATVAPYYIPKRTGACLSCIPIGE